ncbi:hypothetical protein [Desulfovibrio sp. JC022]|uniref:hypothetical protein n=1 Tax=Desulfovibrio sp. JC022 TaxID=2593642 RepID=UPI0013D2650B|nr:hypothetical protein [Desulfovibrio sp. JC022]
MARQEHIPKLYKKELMRDIEMFPKMQNKKLELANHVQEIGLKRAVAIPENLSKKN